MEETRLREQQERMQAAAVEKAAIKQKLEALELKQQNAVALRIQAQFRGLKCRAFNKGRFAAVVDLKAAKEKENMLRKEE